MNISEKNLKNERIISMYKIDKLKRKEEKMLAEELRAISLGLEGKVYEPNEIERPGNISRYIIDKSISITEKISDYLLIYLKNFYPTSQKILSSIILGPTISILMEKFLEQYNITPQTSHLVYLGAIATSLSYSLQSVYQKSENQ